MVKLPPKWLEILKDEFEKEYMKNLKLFLIEEQKKYITYPKNKDIFNAFWLTDFDKVKVIILGQDPYHNPNQAHGLAFSVLPPTPAPPSLVNIFKELKDDLGYNIPSNGDLTKWAKEGVLLLNSVLTVRANSPLSHRNKGWEIFTNKVIELLNEKKEHLVFILWGKPAGEKASLIDTNKHLILKAPHPSPLSAFRGFFGSKPFSKTNAYLIKNDINPIDWNLT